MMWLGCAPRKLWGIELPGSASRLTVAVSASGSAAESGSTTKALPVAGVGNTSCRPGLTKPAATAMPNSTAQPPTIM
ncbi:MAG: hypothetical protein PUE52_08715 [Prevotella sp.]|nr:hypothetical protein [Prevotella sp.]